jgi:hypothetical protein
VIWMCGWSWTFRRLTERRFERDVFRVPNVKSSRAALMAAYSSVDAVTTIRLCQILHWIALLRGMLEVH